jgi:hypothetical protein
VTAQLSVFPGNEMTSAFFAALMAGGSRGPPQTYQEFLASPPIEQRRIVALLARVAVPAYEIRARIKEQLAMPSKDPPIMTEGLAALRTEFPSTGPQPGFGPVARAIAAEHAKLPNKPGVFYKVLLHHLDATEARLNRKSHEIDARAIKMPK